VLPLKTQSVKIKRLRTKRVTTNCRSTRHLAGVPAPLGSGSDTKGCGGAGTGVATDIARRTCVARLCSVFFCGALPAAQRVAAACRPHTARAGAAGTERVVCSVPAPFERRFRGALGVYRHALRRLRRAARAALSRYRVSAEHTKTQAARAVLSGRTATHVDVAGTEHRQCKHCGSYSALSRRVCILAQAPPLPLCYHGTHVCARGWAACRLLARLLIGLGAAG